MSRLRLGFAAIAAIGAVALSIVVGLSRDSSSDGSGDSSLEPTSEIKCDGSFDQQPNSGVFSIDCGGVGQVIRLEIRPGNGARRAIRVRGVTARVVGGRSQEVHCDWAYGESVCGMRLGHQSRLWDGQIAGRLIDPDGNCVDEANFVVGYRPEERGRRVADLVMPLVSGKLRDPRGCPASP